MFRRILKGFLILVAVIVSVFVAFLGISSLNEWKPKAVEEAEVTKKGIANEVKLGRTYKMLSWNIGYGGLDKSRDFFMDGGEGVMPDDKIEIEENMTGIIEKIKSEKADFNILQEVDRGSKRTFKLDERALLDKKLMDNSAYADNYKACYVPYPLPKTIGQIRAGQQTSSEYTLTNNKRISLPVPFSWPVRMFNLKRCLLVSETPIDGSSRKLVIVNLHLEAYDDGQGKIAQTKSLMDFVDKEYKKGNYVIAGGDWNQSFAAQIDHMPYPKEKSLWRPGVIDLPKELKEWQLIYDGETPSCRLNNKAYIENSPNTYSLCDRWIPSVT